MFVCEALVQQVLQAIDSRNATGVVRYDKRRELTAAERQLVTDLFQSTGTLADQFGQEITHKEIACLREGQWLNDEVVNFQFALMNERSLLAASDRSGGVTCPVRGWWMWVHAIPLSPASSLVVLIP